MMPVHTIISGLILSVMWMTVAHGEQEQQPRETEAVELTGVVVTLHDFLK
jgi:hypothetical protein